MPCALHFARERQVNCRAVADPFLRCSVDEEHEEQEGDSVNDVGIQSAVMHAREEIGDASHRGTHRPEKESVNDMGLLALPMDGGTEMDGYCLTGILGDVGTEDGVENDPYRIRKSCCCIGHLRQQSGNSSCPKRTPGNLTLVRDPRDDNSC